MTAPDTHHVVYGNGYVVVPNSAVNDDRLSFRARGLLAYMLGRPAGWRFSAKRLCVGDYVEGREAIAKALRELEREGYYRCRRVHVDHGRFRMVTEVAADPSLMPTEDGLPGPGGPGPGGPGPGKAGPYVSTESHYRETPGGSAEVDLATEAAR